jgi:hypothetical protein
MRENYEAFVRYETHRKGARAHGREFLITFDEWYNWWLSNGVDKNYPTTQSGKQLCMCRYGDTGPYHIDNIYCATRNQNTSDARKFKKWNKNTQSIKQGFPAPPLGLGWKKDLLLVTPAGKFKTRAEALVKLGINLSRLRQYQIEKPDQFYWGN